MQKLQILLLIAVFSGPSPPKPSPLGRLRGERLRAGDERTHGGQQPADAAQGGHGAQGQGAQGPHGEGGNGDREAVGYHQGELAKGRQE